MAEIKVPVAELQIGYYIKLPMSWKMHPFLLSSFCIKDDAQLAQLRHLGLAEIIVDTEKSKTTVVLKETPPAPPPPILETSSKLSEHSAEQQGLRRALRISEKAYNESLHPLKEAFSQLTTKPDSSLAIIGTLIHQSNSQLAQLEAPVGFQLVRASTQSDLLLLHSLNVAFISMLMAREAGWTTLQIEDAGLAGLLHDIGELRVPSQIARKRTELTKAELSYLHMHPQYGFEQLSSIHAYSPQIRNVALQHHEHLDGSGYPKGINADKLEQLTRLVSVADYYDEQLHPRNNQGSISPNQILSRLYKRANKQLDATFIQLLIKLMGIYPPGSFIKLDDNSVALVTSSHPDNPLKPTILPYVRGQKPEGVDLINLKDDTRHIVGAMEAHELSSYQKTFFSQEFYYCYHFCCHHRSAL